MNTYRRYTNGYAWTEEETQALIALWPDKTASEVAIALKTGRSRNAVIGKAHRLKLAAKPSPIPPPKPVNLEPPPNKPLKFCQEPKCFSLRERGAYCKAHGDVYYVRPDRRKEPIKF